MVNVLRFIPAMLIFLVMKKLIELLSLHSTYQTLLFTHYPIMLLHFLL